MIKENKKILIIFFGKILQLVIAFLTIRVATLSLEPKEMGNYYLFMSVAGFYGYVFINPIGQYIARHIYEWYEEKKIINIFLLTNIYLILVSFLSLFITYFLYKLGFGNDIELIYFILFISLFIYFFALNQIIIPIMNILGRYLAFSFFTILTQLAMMFFSVYFVNYFESTGKIWFFGQILGYGIVSIIALLFFLMKIQSNFDKKYIYNVIKIDKFRNVINFVFPLSIGVAFLWMQVQSYAIIIDKYVGAEFLGYFGVGISLAFAISSAIESIVTQYFQSIVYKNINDNVKFKLIMNSIIKLIIPIYLFLAIFISLFSINFMSILVDESYYNSYVYVVFGMWIAFFRMSANTFANIAHAKLNTKKLLIPYAVPGILSMIGVYMATQYANYNYFIPIALLVASVIGFFVMFYKMNKLVKIRLDFEILFLFIFCSIPFLSAIYFYQLANILKYNLIILLFFGIYFLTVTFIFIKRRGFHIE